MQQSDANNPASSSPLLRIPPELRNQIYHHVFDTATSHGPDRRDGQSKITSDGLSLNQTCQRVRLETTALLTNYRVLVLHHRDRDLTAWVAHGQPGKARADTLIMPRLLYINGIHWRYLFSRKSGWDDVGLVQHLFPNVQRVTMEGRTGLWATYKRRLAFDLVKVFGRDDLVVVDEDD